MKLFISYAHTDKWQVNQLVELLRQGKHDPWFDKGLVSGFEWQQQLGDAIRQCEVFVYIMSPESVSSEWCQWEFACAVEMGKPILPVLIQPKTPIPDAVGKLQYVDFSEGPTPEAVAQLMGGFMLIATTISREAVPQAPSNPAGKPTTIEVFEKDHVFLSYSSHDVETMHAVRDKLLAAEISVWTAENIEPGAPSWFDAVEKAIEQAKCMIVLLSPHAKQSAWVKREIDYTEGRSISIIPVLVSGKKADAVPFSLSGIQFIDLTTNHDRKVEELIRVVQRELKLVSQQSTASIPEKPADNNLKSVSSEPPIPESLSDSVEKTPPKVAVRRLRIGKNAVRRLLIVIALLVVIVAVVGGVIAGYVIVSYNNIASQYTAQVAALANYTPAFQTARILDSQGEVLAEINSEQGAREQVGLDQVSPEMIYAIVATEDPGFYEDSGADFIAIGRMFLQKLVGSEVVSSASTITQQVANNLILQNQGSFIPDRKLREMVIASEIARTHDKNLILELYLNELYFGNQVYGVEAAAQFYFHKSAADLGLVESALLTGLISSPAVNNPATNPEAAFNTMDDILRRIVMVQCLQFQHAPYTEQPFCIPQIVDSNGNFTQQFLLERAEVQERTYFTPDATKIRYPHFVNFVLAQLEQQFNTDEIFRRGFVVQTTLVPTVQDAAQNALTDMLDQITSTGVNNGAVMVTDPRDGAIRAMVGSADFNNAEINGQVNQALSWQQPGTAIEPVVYAAALEGVGDRNNNGSQDYSEYLTPASILWDVPTTFENPAYTPVNFDGGFRGPISVRYALANDINVAAVKAFAFIGADRFIDMARRLGLTFLNEPPQVTLASAVGATEVRLYDMMAAYGTLANNGAYIQLYSIMNIKDSKGNLVTMAAPPDHVQHIQAEVAFLIQDMLSDNATRIDQFGPNSALLLPEYGDRVAAKPGASSDGRDLWTIGFSRNAVVGVWLGSTNNASTQGNSLEHAAPVWNTTMQAILAMMPSPPSFSADHVIQGEICAISGARPDESCPAVRSEWFITTQPPPPPEQGLVVSLPIDTWTKLEANEFCTEFVETRTLANIHDLTAIEWLGTAPIGQSIARQLGLPIPSQAPPTAACDADTVQPIVRIATPTAGEVVQGFVPITGVVSAAQDFARYQIDILAADKIGTAVMTIGPYINQVPNQAELGQLNTQELANGSYIIRLTVFASAQVGGYVQRSVPITVQNPPQG